MLEDESFSDTRLLAVIVKMFRLSITVVSPYFLDSPLHMFHNNEDNPDIVIVANGGNEDSDDDRTHTTHFCATRKKLN